MESAYKDGKVRAIGIADFQTKEYLELINHSNVVPAVNQVMTHVYEQQRELRGLEFQIGTIQEAYGVLAGGDNRMFSDQILKSIAKNHGKTVEATKLMAVMGLGVKCGQDVEVEVSGDDEETAFEAMKHFFDENL